jgi:hypothetical protein
MKQNQTEANGAQHNCPKGFDINIFNTRPVVLLLVIFTRLELTSSSPGQTFHNKKKKIKTYCSMLSTSNIFYDKTYFGQPTKRVSSVRFPSFFKQLLCSSFCNKVRNCNIEKWLFTLAKFDYKTKRILGCKLAENVRELKERKLYIHLFKTKLYNIHNSLAMNDCVPLINAISLIQLKIEIMSSHGLECF